MEKSIGDFTEKKVWPNLLDATVSCYSGDGWKCFVNSYVCGGGQLNSWWIKLRSMGSYQKFYPNMDEHDKYVLLKEIAKMKLSAESLMTLL